MVGVSIARRYARALLEVAVDAGRIDEVVTEMDTLASQAAATPELRLVFESPSFTRDQRRKIVEAIIERLGFSPVTGNLLRLLTDREKLALVPDIARLYRDLADQAQGRIRARVRTPLALSEADLARLKAVLEQATGKSIQLSSAQDPSLLGGLVAEVGDMTFDGSLKTQLRALRDAALAA